MVDEMRITTSPVVTLTRGESAGRSLLLVRLEVGSDSLAVSGDCGAPAFAADVCVLVDCSWWMHEDKLIEPEGGPKGVFRSKLELARTAIAPLVTELAPGNTLSLVAFSDTASVLVNRVGGNQIDAYHAAVQSFQPRSGCHLAIGLREASRLLRACPPNRAYRVVLLTGGKIEDTRAALLIADELADDGIGIDVVGIGQEPRLLYLQHLVASGSGSACLVNTTEQATGVLRSLVAKAQNVAASNIRVQVTAPQGWWVRGCVRRAVDSLLLSAAGAGEDRVWSARLAGLSPRLDTELFYFMTPIVGTAGPPETPLSLTVDYITPSGQQCSTQRTVSSVLNVGDEPEDSSATVELIHGFSKIEIKCWEKEWEDAAQQGDHGSAEAFLVEMARRLDQLDLSSGQELVTKALQIYRQKRAIPTDVHNALIEFTSAIDVGRLPLASPTSTQRPVAEDRVCVIPPEPAVTPTIDLILEHLLSLCRETLKRRDDLAAVVARYAADIETLRRETAKSPRIALYEVINTWVQRSRDAGPAWIDGQQTILTQFYAALREWDDLERRLAGEEEQRSERLKILRQALGAIAFYRWNDCGWLSSLEGLRQRRALLERACQEETPHGLI